jgi:hypothetical protein
MSAHSNNPCVARNAMLITKRIGMHAPALKYLKYVEICTVFLRLSSSERVSAILAYG